ncbi:GFA family protein [Phenylobacterium sp.]|uniref:GFA family protein n=1 Tax=Phenylobacterium sp. TaxID=1871053 RepID=UPI002BB1AD6C|nr:GFA family protein [Phenylobacterium sp.]HLZ75131.1 GFA family protein [Phenylobacterium sp.]
MHKGSCLCGAITFEVSGALPGPDACHCTMCRKHSGHVFASTDVARSAVMIQGEEHITWFQSSEKVRRGFCAVCGSSLFWDNQSKDVTAIAMGAFDTPTQTELAVHIFIADKGDYYSISDGVAQFEAAPRAAP